MSEVAVQVLVAAEAIVREQLGGSWPELEALALAAARLGAHAQAHRLAEEEERGRTDTTKGWIGRLATTYALLADRVAVERLRERTRQALGEDPGRFEGAGLTIAFQTLGDLAEADRLVAAVEDPEDRASLKILLSYDALARRQSERAASLAREVAAAPISRAAERGTLVFLVAVGVELAAQGDRGTAAELAPGAERVAASLRDDELQASVARLLLAAGRSADALKLARTVARRAVRDLNASWYAELARVLVDAGDAAAGQTLFDRHIGWWENERKALASALAACDLARWGRKREANTMTDVAESQLEKEGQASDDSTRALLVEAYLALGEVAAAIQVAAELSTPTERLAALAAIAAHAHRHAVAMTPKIHSALVETGLAPVS